MASSPSARDSSRSFKRTKVLMCGTLMTPEGAYRVTIRDISGTGAQISATDPIPNECDAVFRRGSLFAAARVAWSRKNEAGIKFYRDLTPDEIASTFHPVITGPGR